MITVQHIHVVIYKTVYAVQLQGSTVWGTHMQLSCSDRRLKSEDNIVKPPLMVSLGSSESRQCNEDNLKWRQFNRVCLPGITENLMVNEQ
jgi:hypothetical protein